MKFKSKLKLKCDEDKDHKLNLIKFIVSFKQIKIKKWKGHLFGSSVLASQISHNALHDYEIRVGLKPWLLNQNMSLRYGFAPMM